MSAKSILKGLTCFRIVSILFGSMGNTSEQREHMGCFWMCNIWLWLHALLQLLLYPIMLYCGFCSLLLPLTYYIICCLSGRLRQYLLLNVPIFLFLVGAFMTYPPVGGLFAVQWIPCFFLGMNPWWKGGLNFGYTERILLYLLALLPYVLMVPFIVMLWKGINH